MALGAIWASRWLVAACVAIAVVGGLVYLHNATYRYTVSLRVAPNTPDSSSLINKLGGLASVAGINLPTDKSASPFDLYIESIDSPDTASDLARDRGIMTTIFADQWDAAVRRWHPPTTFIYGFARGAKRMVGLPVADWHPPAGPELADFINRKVMLVRDAKKSVATIELTYRDPIFAGRFLQQLHQTIDLSLRRRAAARSKEYIDYLTQKLAVTQVSENRQALATALATEERSLMVASGHASYAADPFGGLSVSLQPTEPKIPVILGLSAGVGFAVGAAIAVIRRRVEIAV